uniref:Protein Jade-1 n=1 Tax=Kalanchoe fedtschenkoi TaxID=63787 RepID=A0A7N0RBQ5_KALFE
MALSYDVDFALPAKKRNRNLDDEFLLPTKKRAYALKSATTPLHDAWIQAGASQHKNKPDPAPPTFSLPTKKRVWADFQPHYVSSHLYNPSLILPDHDRLGESHNVEVSHTGSQHEDKTSREKQPVLNGSARDLPQPASSANSNGSVRSGSEHLNQVDNCGGECESEDGIICEICQSTDGDPSDPIVFCDGCELMVHATCYGNPLIKGIPDGDWFCHKCDFFEAERPLKSVSCCLCPSSGGALKPTNDGGWAHIVCAVYVPEVFFVDSEGRDGIDVSKICGKRWKKRCYVCKKIKGCVVDCSEAKCALSFHVTCGLSQDLCIEYREGTTRKGGIVAGFCKDHTQLWNKQRQTGKFKIVAREEQDA